MSNYRPKLDNIIPLVLLVPNFKTISGVRKKIFPTIEEALSVKDENNNFVNVFFGTFKTYGGTETNVNNIYSVIDTAIIETWYRPDIQSDCQIALETGEIYDIINEPENVNKRNQFLKFKVKRIKGKS